MRARVGSLWVITGVARIGLGGRLLGLNGLLGLLGAAPESMDSKANGCWRYPPFLQLVIEILIEKVVKFRPNTSCDFDDFLGIFLI